MRIGFLQYPVAFGDRDENFSRIRAAIGAATFDLLVLPELCSVGYCHASRQALLAHAESARHGPTVQFLLQLSAQTRATWVAGIAEREGDQVYNTAVVVSRGRWLGTQRKCHLTQLEKPLFKAGDTLACFDDAHCRFGVLTCFDLWMPEAARLLVRQGAQLLCCPTNYGAPWTTALARVRAMENATPLICANRSGSERQSGSEVVFRGESQIVGPLGEVWAAATEQTTLAVVDMDPAAYRVKSNPMCADLMAEAARYTLSGPA